MKRTSDGILEKSILVDGNNLLHRVYHSFVASRIKRGEPMLCSPSGYPTGILYGCLVLLSSWLYDIPDFSKITVFFDGLPKRRRDIDKTYKAKREGGISLFNPEVKFPIKLSDGFETDGEVGVLVHILLLLGCDVCFHPDEEADDLIASFVKSKSDGVHVIISDDKDFFQLLTNPKVVVYRPGSPPGNRFLDAEKSELHWSKLAGGGHPKVPSTHVRMFKSLCGDSSDEIIGVDRLRKKVAITLCHHQDVDSLFETDLPGFSDTERQKTFALKDRIKLNHFLTGFFDQIDTSVCTQTGVVDRSTADRILRDDFGMTSVDLSSFFEYQGPVYTPPDGENASQIPLDSWLSEI